MESDPRIVVVTCDVGFNYLEKVSEKYPGRFFNLGVTEASAICICAGMALSGLRPWFYSMINFSAFRPFEMVRNIVALHNAPVVLVGVKGSSSYRFLGFSHNMVFKDEDTYHLEPYMACYTPQTNEEVQAAIGLAYRTEKPAYVRL